MGRRNCGWAWLGLTSAPTFCQPSAPTFCQLVSVLALMLVSVPVSLLGRTQTQVIFATNIRYYYCRKVARLVQV